MSSLVNSTTTLLVSLVPLTTWVDTPTSCIIKNLPKPYFGEAPHF